LCVAPESSKCVIKRAICTGWAGKTSKLYFFAKVDQRLKE
jgi:hypothetical protein